MRAIKFIASADSIVSFGTGNGKLRGVALCAGSGAATLEIFDGTQAVAKSVAKLACAASTSANPADFEEDGILITGGGLSATISGTGAQGYLYYE